MRLITLIPPLLLILVLALSLRVLSWEAPGDSHHTRHPMRHDHQSVDFDFYQHSLPKTLSTGKSHWYFWGFIESCLEISTAHRFKRNLFATICLGGTEAFATGPSLMCPLKGKAYLTGRQNKGVVPSGFDTFIATVTIKDATNMHAWMIAWGHVSYGTDRRA